MLNKWQKALDKSGVVGTLLMDLSKAFDSLNHDLLIAKLAAYGVNLNSLKFLRSYLRNRFQRTRVGSSLSEWLQVLLGVPQGSILGPLLFNIFINDLIYALEDFICNFADDNTIYSCGETFEDVLSHLKELLKYALSWFSSNMLVVNPQKFQMMFLGCPFTDIELKINNDITLSASESVKLLGIIIDHKLSFKLHITNLCKKANIGIRCLYRLRKYLNLEQCLTLLNSYILSVFQYAPIVWMYCSKTSSNEINGIHKRALRAIYNNRDETLESMLRKNELVSIHELHLRYVLCEIYKTINDIGPLITKQLFQRKNAAYNLRVKNLVSIPKAKTSRYGTGSFVFRGSLLWNALSDHLKEVDSLQMFKNSLKSADLTHICTCKQC